MTAAPGSNCPSALGPRAARSLDRGVALLGTGPARDRLRSLAFVLGAACALAPAGAQGAADAESPPVVKLVSTHLRLRVDAEGSGFLYRRGDGVFVLTAEHVGYHSNVLAQHRIFLDARTSARVEYLNSEWSNGLALFRATDPSARFLEAARPLECAPPAPRGAALWVGGFPSGSRALSWSEQGSVSNPRAPREDLLDVREQLEIVESGAEYGMSGGPVFAQESVALGARAEAGAGGASVGPAPKLAGILSSKKSESEDVVWAVPCSVAAAWAARAEESSYKPRFYRFDGGQRHVEAGSLLIRFDSFEGRRTLEIARATDDGPSNTAAIDVPALRTAQEILDRAHGFSRFSYPRAQVFGFLEGYVLRDPNVYGFPRWTQPASLTDGLRKLQQPRLRPVAVVRRQGDDPLFHLGNRMMWTLRSMEFAFGYGSPMGDRIRGMLWIFTRLNDIETREPERILGLLRRQDMEELLNGFEAEWRAARERDPARGRQLRENLSRVLEGVRDYVL